jgi:hypothetical protein
MPQGIPFVQPQFYRPRESGTVTGDPYITGYSSLGSLRNDFGSWVGFQITVGASDMTVTHLGRWVVSGNSGSHDIAIFDGTNIATDSIATANVNTSGQPSDDLTYTALGSPVNLTSGNTYYVMSLESNGGDQWYNYDGTIPTTTADAVLDQSCYDSGGTIAFVISPGEAFGFPGFLYTL